MPSSRNSPGPHDRRRPRVRCSAKRKDGSQCTRWADGKGGAVSEQAANPLCSFHRRQAQFLLGELVDPSDPNSPEVPDPTVTPVAEAQVTGALTTNTKKLAQALINEQSRLALARLKLEPSTGFDPKQALLWTVESAYRQKAVWEAMLAAVPESDFDELGVLPVPGLRYTARGARIEIISRNLAEATKNAAKIAKMAVDAGIEERLVRLAEEQSALIADTVKASILQSMAVLASQLRLSPAQAADAQELALQAAATHLRQLAAGDPRDPVGSRAPEFVEGISERINEK